MTWVLILVISSLFKIEIKRLDYFITKVKKFFFLTVYNVDVDECITGNHDCDVNANCTNIVGGHNCTCKEGFAVKLEQAVKSVKRLLSPPVVSKTKNQQTRCQNRFRLHSVQLSSLH